MPQSIVDYLKSIGQDSSYSAREKLAKDKGITGYSGSAEQNLQLLSGLSGAKPDENYSKELTSQLAQGTQDQDKPDELSEVEKIQADVTDYKTKLDSSLQQIKTIQKDTYDKEYTDRKLDAKKAQISTIDSEIATAKSQRDEAINKVRSNPGLSAAQMTGDIKKLADYQNNKINNLIDQRNSVAGEYNAELSEIDKIVDRETKSVQSEYDYYAGLLGRSDTKLSDYQKALRDELSSDRTQENWEKEMAQALQIAQMNAAKSGSGSTTKLQLVTDDYGNPTATFNPLTGEIDPIEEDAPVGTGYEGIDTELNKKESGEPWYKRLWGAVTGK